MQEASRQITVGLWGSVVVPPDIWIEQAHQAHKLVLGTFLFEGKGDSIHAQKFLESEATRLSTATKLVDLCVFYGFDGFLINIETDLGRTLSGALVSFLTHLRAELKARVGSYAQVPASSLMPCSLPCLSLSLYSRLPVFRNLHGQVIYYDSLDQDGRAKHLNALIGHNKAYFEACDGIFVNYQWFDYDTVARSRAEAGHRPFDVYAGVDVWARNCRYDEGPGCKKAVESATQVRKPGMLIPHRTAWLGADSMRLPNAG